MNASVETEDSLEELASLPTMAQATASPSGDEVALYYDITGRNQLHVLDTESGDLDQWSDGEVPRDARWHLTWDDDGERVFFHRDEDGNEQNDIYALDRSGEVETVVEIEGQSSVVDVSADSLVFGSNRDGQMNAYRHDFATGETSKLTDYDRAVWGGVLSPDGEQFAYSTNETDDYDNKDVYVMDIDGSNARNLELGEVGAEASPVDWGPEGERLLVGDNSTDLGRMGVYDLDTEEVTWLGDDSYEESPEAFMPDGERVIGTRARDAVTIPVVYDLDSGERLSPLIVNPHGGPRARDSKRFNLYTQVLVSQGFSVLQVNYRGSTGRGREFVEELIDDWGGAEQGDVAIATEHVLAEYDWLDEDRVVVFGGSYGGYSAYWQMVQYPDLYGAGIAWIGLTDLEGMFEGTMPHYRTELMEKYMGTPEDNPDLYEQRSPLTHAENLDAPLFMVHGVNDRRVPVSQARVFREKLDELGYEAGEDADFEYRELGEEGHASSDQDQKLRMFRLLADFLDRRV